MSPPAKNINLIVDVSHRAYYSCNANIPLSASCAGSIHLSWAACVHIKTCITRLGSECSPVFSFARFRLAAFALAVDLATRFPIPTPMSVFDSAWKIVHGQCTTQWSMHTSGRTPCTTGQQVGQPATYLPHPWWLCRGSPLLLLAAWPHSHGRLLVPPLAAVSPAEHSALDVYYGSLVSGVHTSTHARSYTHATVQWWHCVAAAHLQTSCAACSSNMHACCGRKTPSVLLCCACAGARPMSPLTSCNPLPFV